MRRIGVTMEVTKREYREFEISDEAYKKLLAGYSLENTLGNETVMEFRDDVDSLGDYEMDYAVTDENGVTIIDWK